MAMSCLPSLPVVTPASAGPSGFSVVGNDTQDLDAACIEPAEYGLELRLVDDLATENRLIARRLDNDLLEWLDQLLTDLPANRDPVVARLTGGGSLGTPFHRRPVSTGTADFGIAPV
jgi:hypothetical protein